MHAFRALSGALAWHCLEHRHMENKGMAEPIPAQKAPYGVNVEAGKDYWWCACGRSAKQPFCDGSHKSVGLAPQKFIAAETKQVWLCGCKSSGNKPFCDGTHKSM
jgi:CDGSH-type Zn-finger protein